MTTDPGFWTEVAVRVLPEASETVAAVLRELTRAGVAIEPPIEALGPDEGYILDSHAPLTLRAYLFGEVSASDRRYVRDVLRRLGLTSAISGSLRWRQLREEDWANSWKDHYTIEHVGRIVIRPAWLDYDPAPGEVVIALDPGMAFGTGQHPTTRMCLQALQEYLQPGDRVLDLGTGSGILALAATALGAESCLALDIEPQAVAAAMANVALNQAGGRITVRLGSLEPAGDQPPFDFAFANINAATVTSLAAVIASNLRPGGVALAGGIIEERLAPPREALAQAGFEILTMKSEGDWRTLVARKSR